MAEMSPFTQLAVQLTARWLVDDCRPLSNREVLELAAWLGPEEDLPADLAGCPIDPERFRALQARDVFEQLERWSDAGIWVRSVRDSDFPVAFTRLKNRAPALLYGAGDICLLSLSGFAIVGSRNASEERLEQAAEVARSCVLAELCVVSGGARGVDSAAMQAALEAGGKVVGILSDSLLRATRRSGIHIVLDEGDLCLVSEVHPEAGFDVGNAMARNRLAYACAEATLIVECDPGTGGTWQGATDALKEGRKVFVIEGARAETELRSHGAKVVDLREALQPLQLIEIDFESQKQTLGLFDQ